MVKYPCTYTDEEFEEELRLSEASGYATDEEVKALLDRFTQSRPKDVDLTDEEIMEEVKAVRYKD